MAAPPWQPHVTSPLMKQHAAPFAQRLVDVSEHAPLSPCVPPPVSAGLPLSSGACASLASTGGDVPAS
jgi:hypothetical protein